MLNNIFVFSSVGSKLNHSYKHKVFQSWETKNIDSGCVQYNLQDTFQYNKYFKHILYNNNYKFPNFFYYNTYKNILDKYKYVLIIDDDLKFDQLNTIQSVLSLMIKHNLQLCSISNNGLGKSSYPIMTCKNLSDVIYLTNFCEMGCVFLETKVFKDRLFEINKYDIKDFGFDVMLSNIYMKHHHRIGIIKNLTFYNPPQRKRSYAISNWKQYENIFPIPHIKILETIQIC